MKMILRWFAQNHDSVALWQIRQIPGVSGVATCLPDYLPGQVWPAEIIGNVKAEINRHDLEMEVIESVNVHEDIKKGLSSRDQYIDNYITTLHNLAAAGVKCLCYNFMPVIDWTRSNMAHQLPDNSTVLSYRHQAVIDQDPLHLSDSIRSQSGSFSQPGWEPERIPQMLADREFYQSMSENEYWNNLSYFLDAVVPVAELLDIRLAIHPDDPPWPLYGLPKLLGNRENLSKFLQLNPSQYNGLSFCTGSLGANSDNDLPAMIRQFAGEKRIHFVHLRNIKRLSLRDFDESAHYSPCGDLDMVAIVRTLIECGFSGYIRPDHGRMIWGEQARPGYGLYDRALGSQYILGLWQGLSEK